MKRRKEKKKKSDSARCDQRSTGQDKYVKGDRKGKRIGNMRKEKKPMKSNKHKTESTKKSKAKSV